MTATPGRTAPVESVTVPLIAPASCAMADGARAGHNPNATVTTKTVAFIRLSLDCAQFAQQIRRARVRDLAGDGGGAGNGGLAPASCQRRQRRQSARVLDAELGALVREKLNDPVVS